MNDWIKKGFSLGLGAAYASKEKAEKYVNDLVAKGDIAPNEAKQMIQELSEKGQGKQEEWSESFREEIRSSLKQLGFVTTEEADKLKERLNQLEAKLDGQSHDQE